MAMNAKNEGGAVDRRSERLRELIALPAPPVEVWFEQVPRGAPGGLGPTDYLLVAVMRFRPDDLARLTAAAPRRPGSPPRVLAAAQRPWLPEPVKAAIRPHDERSVTVRGEKFDAAAFAKSPFLSGSFVAVEGGEYVLLVLQTT
jgi:AcrR family transcriptional regulator